VFSHLEGYYLPVNMLGGPMDSVGQVRHALAQSLPVQKLEAGFEVETLSGEKLFLRGSAICSFDFPAACKVKKRESVCV
jgi:hypothetical protein